VPRLSVIAVRASLIYLTIGFTLGSLLLWHKSLPVQAGLFRWLAVHREFLLLGWSAQLAMGVAYWILPRFARGPERGSDGLAWLAIALFNLGIVLVATTLLGAPAEVVPLGRMLEVVGALAFAAHAWPRVKPFGV
jgi:cbb3-type cytochrome oxidase subunit 1